MIAVQTIFINSHFLIWNSAIKPLHARLVSLGTGISVVALAAILIYLGSILNFSLPGTDIPQTAQTIAVLIIGSVLGAVVGTAAVVIYILTGVLGLPVFSDGGFGLDHLLGSSGGYLFGFAVAAGFIGFWTKIGYSRQFGLTLIGMLFGHLIILLLGWLWLTTTIGAVAAYSGGVAPFYVGALAKSILAALVVQLIRSYLYRKRAQSKSAEAREE